MIARPRRSSSVRRSARKSSGGAVHARALKIDVSLVNRPKLRAKAEALARDPGGTIQAVVDLLAAAGLNVSYSGTHRWMQRLRRATPIVPRSLLASVIRKVTTLTEPELQAVGGYLGIMD